MTNIISKTQHM